VAEPVCQVEAQGGPELAVRLQEQLVVAGQGAEGGEGGGEQALPDA
jgi:hypothetical protein